ncbi:N-formylglutamate amidohydrolase [Pikeienuella piscinae]|uniref:N-formylglutamate amidohydrolase n=1 Tax=Pikeienuella piscinae TaxID=2748098 RepID=A0A7M3T6C0_9RHOB|nr:N-formylglutamate amidohydrolase [Pikeienuella piscinae]QIE57551.1 N-formylglutamate amidohydrolase [Pikeienuella piscinae]
MVTTQPFHLTEPETLSAAAVFSSPHSGRIYPDDLIRRARLDRHALRASEDAFVDRLFSAAPDSGAPLIAAAMPRAYVDLNRGPEELDPAVVRDVRATGLNPRVAAGLGVIPRIVAEGRPIYEGKIGLDEARARIAACHTPYHRKLEALMTRAAAHFGYALLFDCHSMPSDALRAAPRVRGGRAQIVLGDRFGASAARPLMQAAIDAFERAGFVVAVNAPFAGGHITQRYGRPSQNWHAIQIEIDRGLYLDQNLVTPGPGYAELNARLARVIPELALIGRAGALAAE